MPEEEEIDDVKQITDKTWKAWRDEMVAMCEEVQAKVPEVGFCLTVAADKSVEYTKEFVRRWKEDKEVQKWIRGAGQGSDYPPTDYVEQGKILIEGGIELVNVHVGEWAPWREEKTVKEALRRLDCAITMGSKRLGHGILLHIDEGLMDKGKKQNVCLEVCPCSNMILDEVQTPCKFKNHPLRALFDYGIPVTINSDDPCQFGTYNGQGLVREYQAAREMMGFTNSELATLAKNSFIYSLASEEIK